MSKAFECLQYEALIGKPYAYGFDLLRNVFKNMGKANINKEHTEWDTMYISHRIGCPWTPHNNYWLESKVLKPY